MEPVVVTEAIKESMMDAVHPDPTLEVVDEWTDPDDLGYIRVPARPGDEKVELFADDERWHPPIPSMADDQEETFQMAQMYYQHHVGQQGARGPPCPPPGGYPRAPGQTYAAPHLAFYPNPAHQGVPQVPPPYPQHPPPPAMWTPEMSGLELESEVPLCGRENLAIGGTTTPRANSTPESPMPVEVPSPSPPTDAESPPLEASEPPSTPPDRPTSVAQDTPGAESVPDEAYPSPPASIPVPMADAGYPHVVEETEELPAVDPASPDDRVPTPVVATTPPPLVRQEGAPDTAQPLEASPASTPVAVVEEPADGSTPLDDRPTLPVVASPPHPEELVSQELRVEHEQQLQQLQRMQQQHQQQQRSQLQAQYGYNRYPVYQVPQGHPYQYSEYQDADGTQREQPIMFEAFDLKVIYQVNKTGFEEHKDFPIRNNSIIAGRYQIVEYLGSAAFSRAVQCVDLKNGQLVCIKIIRNNKDFFDQSLDEIKLLQYINSNGDADEHCVLQLYDYFYHKEHLFLVCELLRDNLYEFSKYNRESGDEPYFTIPRLQKIARQVLTALKFVHRLNLIHCDLKPENILIKSYSRCEVKVIDFGSSCFTTDHLSSYVQSRCYRAPEVILGLPYGRKLDIWSLGAILPELYTGRVLFHNDSVPTMLARIMAICGNFPEAMLRKARYANRFFTKSSMLYERNKQTAQMYYLHPKRTILKNRIGTEDPLFLDFVRQLLQLDPDRRPTADEALQHPWLAYDYGCAN